jgi:hypothetical protein
MTKMRDWSQPPTPVRFVFIVVTISVFVCCVWFKKEKGSLQCCHWEKIWSDLRQETMATVWQSGQVGGATFALVFVAFLWRLGWWWADQVRHTLLLLWRSTDSILFQYVSEITRHVDVAFCHCDFLPLPQKTQLDQHLPILPSERERESWKQYELDAVQTCWLVPNCRKEETDSLPSVGNWFDLSELYRWQTWLYWIRFLCAIASC